MSISDLQGRKEPTAPAEPTRFKAFANFFKSYMSVSAVVAAALPIPVAAWKLIPMYDAQRGILGAYVSLFCFLTLAFIFYRRHTFARLMFYDFLDSSQKTATAASRFFSRALINWLPAILILLCFASIVLYLVALRISISDIIPQARARLEIVAPLLPPNPVIPIPKPMASPPPASPTPSAAHPFAPLVDVHELDESIIRNLKWYEIPNGELLIAFYLLIFLSAEAAFVLMATKEYLQDLLKVSEHELIFGPSAKTTGHL